MLNALQLSISGQGLHDLEVIDGNRTGVPEVVEVARKRLVFSGLLFDEV
jgi:hypothetical protein